MTRLNADINRTPNDCIRIFFKMKQEPDPKDIFIKGVFIG